MEERQDHATRTISIVMIIALVGKVLGLYRDHLLAVYYGTGMAANAFNTASRIPRVFFDAVFASAISACFIPVFSEYLTRKGRELLAEKKAEWASFHRGVADVLSGEGEWEPEFLKERQGPWSACLPTDMMPRRRSWPSPSPG